MANTRELLKQVYPNKTWGKKVDRMTEAQVAAVYLRLKAQGKIS